MSSVPFNPLESPEGRPELEIKLNDGVDEQVSIIIPHHDRPEYLNILLQSIHVCSHLNNYEVIVVDNASGQETQDYFDVLEKEGVKIVRNKENLFWSAACNQGVTIADPGSKYLIFMHADTVVLNPSWIDLLVNLSVAHDSGMIGTQLGQYWIQKQKVEFVQEWCMLLSRRCWADIGPWPEELPLLGMSFIMTLRAQLRGHKPQTTGNYIVHHYKQFSGDPSEFEAMSEKAMGTVAKLMQQQR